MACPSLLEVLVSVAQLPDSGPDIYASEGPLIQQPVGEDAFGGSIIGQAVSAANSTVPSGFDIYSAQSSFLRPIKANQAVAYHVDRIADGRTSCTRIVRATQGGGPCLFVSIMAFQKPRTADGSPAFADPKPDVGGRNPADLPRQGFEQINFQIGQEDKLARLGVRAEEPFDWRLLPLQPGRDPSQPRTCGFVRASATTPLTHSAAVSMASLALLSDQSLFELSLFANWDSAPDKWRRLAMTISLNSRISFHVSTAKLDEWMVCDSGISWGANGRLSTNQRFWSHETGELLMTCSQDAVISRQESAL
ncbi:Thioesterase/thiol ester dehydrase-isomerase [Apiospora arundinis]